MQPGFFLFSTAGNTTLFVDQPCDLQKTMRIIPAEQAGVFSCDDATLTMGGGELCVNATLAFAALLDLHGRQPGFARAANQTLPIEVSGQAPCWRASLTIKRSLAKLGREKNMLLVYWPGITHALIECEQLPDNTVAMQKAAILLDLYGLKKYPAAGIVWWTKSESDYAIMPVVHVPGLNTTFIEGACGSASISLATALDRNTLAVRQISGEHIDITRAGDDIEVAAPVRLLAEGKLWL